MYILEDVWDIIEFVRVRGIWIILEFDVLGIINKVVEVIRLVFFFYNNIKVKLVWLLNDYKIGLCI